MNVFEIAGQNKRKMLSHWIEKKEPNLITILHKKLKYTCIKEFVSSKGSTNRWLLKKVLVKSFKLHFRNKKTAF